MKLLIVDQLNHSLLDSILGNNIIYRPDLRKKTSGLLSHALTEGRVDAVISRSLPPAEVLRKWERSNREPTFWIRLVIGGEHQIDSGDVVAESSGTTTRILLTGGVDETAAYASALRMLETINGQLLAASRSETAPICASDSASRKVVQFIGAGLVNLICAWRLQREGFEVRLLDGGPDPRAQAPWTAYGCSHGGDDARMFTLSEMDNYNDKSVSPDMNRVFRNDVSNLGWRIHARNTLSQHEQVWISEFESIPVWLAEVYNEDIFAFNRESLPLWNAWLAEAPDLFEASHRRDGILRLYSDSDGFAAAVRRQDRIGATRKVLNPDAVAQDHPALAGAVRGGGIAGGVFVEGFTVNAHKFVRELLRRLEQGGGKFEWNEKAEKLLRDDQGRVVGIQTSDRVLKAHHYVVSPGAYGDNLLEGTRSHGKIHGVLGAWLRLPNVDPKLTNSLKLSRKGHITEDANITVATDAQQRPIMIIGSGYGHTGINPANIDHALLRRVYDGLIDTARRYFPDAYDSARQTANIEDSLKYCVRPWSSTGLGIYETLDTTTAGACVITGGHNTGGFTQAPAVAEAILATFASRAHAMHVKYDPGRLRAFLGAPEGETAPENVYAEVS